MILEAYAVHDSAVGAYNRPMFFRSRGEAVRSFQQACNTPEAGFLSHPEHYSFWLIGLFDEATGVLSATDLARVCGAVDFVIKS